MQSTTPAILSALLLTAATLVAAPSSLLAHEMEHETPSTSQDEAPRKSSVTADYVRLTRATASAAIERARKEKAPQIHDKTVLSLEDCRTLALDRNLSMQQALLETKAKKAVSSSYQAQLFPRVIGSGELSHRNNEPFAFSEVLGKEGLGPGVPGSGTGVNQFSRGHDLGTWRYTEEARWSPTDAALAYFLMKSSRNDATKEKLLRIRVAQKLLGAVEAAYYRLLTLQKVEPLLKDLLAKREDLQRQAAEVYAQDLSLIEDLHRIHQKAIQARGLAATIAAEIDLQREYLGSSMRVPPDAFGGNGFVLSGDLPEPADTESMQVLEEAAIEHRPEAYQAGLDHLSAKNDLKRTNVKFYPKVTGFQRYSRDVDQHLLHPDWNEYGAYIYFDVVDLATNAAEHRAAKLRRDRTRSEIESVALSIATQVREAALKYRQATAEVRTAAEVRQSTQKLLETIQQRTRLGANSELALLETKGDSLQDEIGALRALGEANARRAELQSETGTNYAAELPR